MRLGLNILTPLILFTRYSLATSCASSLSTLSSSLDFQQVPFTKSSLSAPQRSFQSLKHLLFFCAPKTAVVTLLHEPKNNSTNVTESCNKPTFKSISFTTLELFKFTIGMGDLEFTEKYENIHAFYMLLLSYLVLTYILLLNMLIALMSKTVEDMSEKSSSIWKLQVHIPCPMPLFAYMYVQPPICIYI